MIDPRIANLAHGDDLPVNVAHLDVVDTPHRVGGKLTMIDNTMGGKPVGPQSAPAAPSGYLQGFAQAILAGLSADRSKHVYGGTVPADVIAARRTKNRAARAARRITRRR